MDRPEGPYKALKRRDSGWRRDDSFTWDYINSSGAQPPSPWEDGIVNRLYSSISQVCGHVLLNLQNSEEARLKEPMSTPLYRLLDSAYTSFITWGTDLHVGKGDLDKSLQLDQQLRQLTVEILIGMCETIDDELHPVLREIFKDIHSDTCPVPSLERKLERMRTIKAEAAPYAQITPDSHDDERMQSTVTTDGKGPTTPSDISSLEETLESLGDQVEALISLTPSLKHPVPDTIVDMAEANAAEPQPQGASAEDCKYLTFFHGIKIKNPECDDRLAMAISKHIHASTIRLIQKKREAASNPQTLLSVLRPEKAASELFPKDSGYETATRDPTHRVPTPAVQGVDSLQSERDSKERYARTLKGYKDDNGTISTPFPSQPKELSIGESFACMACGRQVLKSQSVTIWRKHILSDLQPWICCQIKCDCEFKSFSTRDEWIEHLDAIHKTHPKWNVTQCPFCQEVIEKGQQEMIDHVERHLIQLSLAALTPEHDDSGDDTQSDLESDEMDTRKVKEDDKATPENPRALGISISRLQTHPVYRNARQADDGAWHCPWEGEADCRHQPTVLKSDHDDFIKYHLESLLCDVEGCTYYDPFATQEILHLHKLENHGMHKGGGRFLCTSPGCGRSREGNGFMDPWLQLQHIKKVHENIPDIDLPKGS